MARSRITSKGQVTIPSNVREYLSLQAGDQIEFIVLKNGTVVVQPAYIDVIDLAGALARPKGKTLSVAVMNKIIKARGMGKNVRR